MGVAFQREPFVQAWVGIEPMLAAHWREVAYAGGYPADQKPVADLPIYAAACAEGRLATFTVRQDDGVQEGPILGYALFWIGPFPQRKGAIGAWQDAVYLTPEARQGHVGTDFLHYCDAQLGAIGCHVVHHSVREGCDFSGVLRRLGYVRAETIYAKHLRT